MNHHPWYFGWNIVAAASLLTMLTVGMRLGIGPFFLPMTQDLGFSRSLLSSIIGIGMLCYGLAMPVAGYLVGRWGTRTVLLVGTALVLVSVFWTVTARTPFSFMLAFGVLMSIGLGFTSPVSLTPIISRWFIRERGMALFFLSTGSMAGIAILTPVLTLLIEALGWQHTLLVFAATFTLITVPTALFLMRENPPKNADLLPEQISAQTVSTTASAEPEYLPFSQAIWTMSFWKIVAGLFACGFSMNLLGTHGMPMLMDHGFSAMTGSYGIGLIGLVGIIGTLVLGRLSDHMPRRNMLSLIYLVRGLGFFALLVVSTPIELYAVTAIAGLVWAGALATASAMLADIYGVKVVGVLYGTAYIGHQVGAMISSWLGGWAYEHFGTHWVAFGSAGAILLVAAAVSLRLPLKPCPLLVPAVPAKT